MFEVDGKRNKVAKNNTHDILKLMNNKNSMLKKKNRTTLKTYIFFLSIYQNKFIFEHNFFYCILTIAYFAQNVTKKYHAIIYHIALVLKEL